MSGNSQGEQRLSPAGDLHLEVELFQGRQLPQPAGQDGQRVFGPQVQNAQGAQARDSARKPQPEGLPAVSEHLGFRV